MVPLTHYLASPSSSSSSGRRSPRPAELLTVLMSIELMLNAANLNLIAFPASSATSAANLLGLYHRGGGGEAAIGLAILISLYRLKGSVNLDDAAEMKADARHLAAPWIPLFPSRGSRQRLFYLISTRSWGARTRRRAARRRHGSDASGHGRRRGLRARRHTAAQTGHGSGHGGTADRPIPFAALHSVSGRLLRPLPSLRPPRDRLLVGETHGHEARRDALDLGADGLEPDLVRAKALSIDVAFRLDALSPSCSSSSPSSDAHHVYSVATWARRRLRPLFLLPEPLHVRDADARPRSEPPILFVGWRRRPLLVPPDRLLLGQDFAADAARRRSS